MEGLGTLRFVKTTREAAVRPVTPAKTNIDEPLAVDGRIPNAHAVDAVVYRVTLSKDDDPGTSFATDDRQEIKNVDGKSFELHVRAVRGPSKQARKGEADPEYLTSNLFLNSDDAMVRQFARKAVGDETDPWRKAQRVEKWVHDNMRVQNFSVAMATADRVARTLTGDCSEYAMLTAAMCRSAGVPSRTAQGLIYVEGRKGPSFAYHMWVEVWVRGQWIPLDATLGNGSVGAAHVKISDHSWHKVESLTPLLPVMRVMLGKPAFKVIRVE